jgi:hypothetical protein
VPLTERISEMTAKVILLLATGSTLASVLLSPAMATPATAADLEGRKICWDSGNTSSFMPGGKYSSPAIGDGTWSMTAQGVEIHTSYLSAILDIDKLPDGTFKSNLEKAAGKYCE